MRKRVRAQDLYDLYHVFQVTEKDLSQDDVQQRILKRLITKAASRGLGLTPDSMSNPEIIRRTRKGYETYLPSIVEGELLSFDDIYPQVEEFYRSLPWG
ncbi:MAG: nucleotidyl transferase AbiEii/AbiGii toxin family protein [Desulfobulbaceae bacterium]|nr:nucleotidyl transferase AbiEii/AbiGii toxin family protein [Desulfobulbaceae bacterium]